MSSARRNIAGVPQPVENVARRKIGLPGLQCERLFADGHIQTAFEQVDGLILARVQMKAPVASWRHGGANQRELVTGLHTRKMDLHGNSEEAIRKWLLNIQWSLADHLHSVVMNMRLFDLFPSHIIRTSGAFSIL
jgi:hypothetical protein